MVKYSKELSGSAISEYQLWYGNPSQLINTHIYLICLLLSWLIVPLFIGFWKYLWTKACKFEITTDRIIMLKGLVSRTFDEVKISSIENCRLVEPFWLKWLGLTTLVITTSDEINKTVVIPALRNGRALSEKIRIARELKRAQKIAQKMARDKGLR